MVAGASLGWPSPSIKHLLSGDAGFVVRQDQVATIVSFMDLGNVLSPIPSGYLMDWMGRKPTLLITALLYIMSSILTLTAVNVEMIYVARILVGMGKGIAFGVVPIFLGEVSSVTVRGALSTMFIGFLNFGMFYDYAIGPFVSYQLLNWLNFLLPVLFGLSFLFVPETPYYLLKKGDHEGALRSLKTFRQSKEDDPVVLDELMKMEISVQRDMENKGRFVDLFIGVGRRKALLIIVVTSLCQRLSGISPTLAYSTTIMPSTGGGLSPSSYMIIFSLILVGANYVATPLVDRAGRKLLLLWSSATSAVIMAIAGVYYYLAWSGTDVSSINWIPYACLLIYGATYSLGIGFLPSTLVAELFPTNVKSHAASVSAILLAAASFFINKIFLPVETAWGIHVMYWFFSLASIINFVFVMFYVFETKGKTFTEIQDILNQNDVKAG
jgi:sugar porter (SP) family MFS transporter